MYFASSSGIVSKQRSPQFGPPQVTHLGTKFESTNLTSLNCFCISNICFASCLSEAIIWSTDSTSKLFLILGDQKRYLLLLLPFFQLTPSQLVVGVRPDFSLKTATKQNCAEKKKN